MFYMIFIAVFVIWFFYQYCVVRYPPNYPPGPRIIIPFIGTSLEEVYRIVLGQDEIEKHDGYRKRYIYGLDCNLLYLYEIFIFQGTVTPIL